MTRGAQTVIHVTPRLDARGGVAAVVRSLLASDLAREYDLRVVETAGDGPSVLRALQSALGVMRGAVVIAASPGALVHLHTASGGSFRRKAALARWARLLGHPVVVHVHGARFDTFATEGGPGRRRAVARFLSEADGVVVLSRSWLGRIQAITPEAKVTVVPNGVSIPQRPARGSTPPTVVFSGRIGARKGVPELVRAIGRLQARGVRARWVIAGDGDVEATRESVSGLPDAGDVSVPGWVAADDLQRILCDASVFCLPSHDEGLPIALLEAMAAGIACVVTPVGGMPEAIEGGVTGLVVPVGDADALAEALGSVLADDAMRARLGAAARETAVQRFSVQVMARSLGRLYAGLGCPSAEAGDDERDPRSA